MRKYIVLDGTDSTNVLLNTDSLQEAVIKRGVVTEEYLFKPKIYQLIDVEITVAQPSDRSSDEAI